LSRIGAGLVSGVWALSLFVAMFGVVLNVPVVWGSGTIYIRADGSLDPPTAPIRREGDLYTFIDDINEPLVIERDNTIVDGAGYKLEGIGASYSKGVDIPGRSNVVICNVDISAFEYGIYLNRSQNTRIIGNNITNGTINSRGIFLDGSSNNAILRNNITNNFIGIQTFSSSPIYSSGHNNIFENNITNNGYGLYLGSSNIIVGNNIVRNEHWSGGCGVHLGGGSDNIFFHNNLIDNDNQADSSSSNVGDDGYPSGGNYWSDFEGRYPDVEDVYSGPYQNETGSDGIWDQSYGIQYIYHELVGDRWN